VLEHEHPIRRTHERELQEKKLKQSLLLNNSFFKRFYVILSVPVQGCGASGDVSYDNTWCPHPESEAYDFYSTFYFHR
jgi:hypothetical protein